MGKVLLLACVVLPGVLTAGTVAFDEYVLHAWEAKELPEQKLSAAPWRETCAGAVRTAADRYLAESFGALDGFFAKGARQIYVRSPAAYDLTKYDLADDQMLLVLNFTHRPFRLRIPDDVKALREFRGTRSLKGGDEIVLAPDETLIATAKPRDAGLKPLADVRAEARAAEPVRPDGQRPAGSSPTLSWFEENVYGRPLPKPARVGFHLTEGGDAFGGLATRRQYVVTAADKAGDFSFEALVYLPKGAEGPVAAFVYPNFSGNHSIVDDPAVPVREIPMADPQSAHGARTNRIPVRRLLERGFAVATFSYNTVCPDLGNFHDSSPESCYRIYPDEVQGSKPRLAHPAWSWGSMRVRDLLETIPEVDQACVAVAGQSRMAKNAIFTAVYDTRFALACANCGGTKPLKHLPNLICPYWFAPGLRRHAMNAMSGLPIDVMEKAAKRFPDPPYEQSDFMAQVAPRALYVGEADGDLVSPVGTTLGLVKKADPAFVRAGHPIGWHVKHGPHSITAEDWEHFMDYAVEKLGWKGKKR